MEKLECKICGKVIEGYSRHHVDFLMDQHMRVHRFEIEKDDGGEKNVVNRRRA